MTVEVLKVQCLGFVVGAPVVKQKTPEVPQVHCIGCIVDEPDEKQRRDPSVQEVPKPVEITTLQYYGFGVDVLVVNQKIMDSSQVLYIGCIVDGPDVRQRHDPSFQLVLMTVEVPEDQYLVFLLCVPVAKPDVEVPNVQYLVLIAGVPVVRQKITELAHIHPIVCSVDEALVDHRPDPL